MKQTNKINGSRELYVAPVCDCEALASEGIICDSVQGPIDPWTYDDQTL